MTDLIIAVLGAAIGAATTIWVAYLAFKDDRKKEEEKRIQTQIEKVRYLKSLVNSIIPKMKSLITSLEEVHKGILTDPLNLPLLELTTYNDLERVVHKINQEEYYHAYLGQFEDSTEEFRRLYSGLDFFEAAIRQIKESQEKSVAADYERKQRFKHQSENTLDMAVFMVRSENLKPYQDTIDFINNLFVDYYKNRTDESDLLYLHDNLLVKLRSFLVRDAPHTPEIHNLIIELKKCIYMFTDIKMQNSYAAQGIEMYKESILKTVEKFGTISNRLRTY